MEKKPKNKELLAVIRRMTMRPERAPGSGTFTGMIDGRWYMVTIDAGMAEFRFAPIGARMDCEYKLIRLADLPFSSRERLRIMLKQATPPRGVQSSPTVSSSPRKASVAPRLKSGPGLTLLDKKAAAAFREQHALERRKSRCGPVETAVFGHSTDLD